jgi:hypothetical protein
LLPRSECRWTLTIKGKAGSAITSQARIEALAGQLGIDVSPADSITAAIAAPVEA